jgi:preprotein translocase subunit SecF
MNLIRYRRWYYAVSLLLIVPGVISLFLWGLKPSIDFTGGTRWEISGISDANRVSDFMKNNEVPDVMIQKIGNNSLGVRFKEITEDKHKDLKNKLSSLGADVKESSFETVGPSVSKEITRNAFISVILAALVIIVYVGYSFRKVPYPANSWEFGVAAISDLLYDVIIVTGIFSILGHYFNVEVDPLFITALLTVIGFSVHDTIVIFDRIRENLIKKGSGDFEEVVNESLVEMLPRTINTSFLVWVILLVLYLFGGSSIRYFVLALVIGIFSGSCSSIINSASLLVTWENFKKKRSQKRK